VQRHEIAPAGDASALPEDRGVLGTRKDPEPQRQSVEVGAAPEARAVFEGAVIGEGAPVVGARIELLRHEALVAETSSDSRGRFQLMSQPLSGSGTLRILARGFVPTERSLAGKPAGGTTMLGNLRLLRGVRLTGRVVDGTGNGIPDAELRVEPLHAGGDRLVARGRSGADGRFEIPDAPPGAVLVSARAKGLGEQSVQHAPDAAPLEIQLLPGAELRLRLQTPRGEPVVGAEVAIHGASDSRAPRREAASDAEGRVVFEGLAERVWTVRVTHPEFRPSGRGQVQANGKEEIIECQPWPAIEGLVLAPGGAPPPRGTRVQALPASAPSERLATIEGGQEVEPDGRFRVGGLRAGDWRVLVAAPGFAQATSAPVRLGIEGDGHAGTILLEAGAKLVLSLTLEREPAIGAEVQVFTRPPTPAQLWSLAAPRGKGSGRRVSSGPDGRAVLENLSEEAVWVAVFAEGCPPTLSGPHASNREPAPEPIAIELTRGARLSGRVLGKTGTPVGGAQLRIVDRSGRLGFPLSLASEQDGRYISAWLPPGHYSIEAFASQDPTQRSGRQDLEVEAGEQRVLDLTL
jgi:hypothetical protein